MCLAELQAQGFRNLAPEPIVFSAGLIGENSAGKTSALEAVALLAGQRSFRGAKPRQMAGELKRLTALLKIAEWRLVAVAQETGER